MTGETELAFHNESGAGFQKPRAAFVVRQPFLPVLFGK
jgi:hypothetical protein